MLDYIDFHKGYLPAREGAPTDNITFCSGIPGAIPMLTAAIDLFPSMQTKLLAAATRAGEITWKEGLLLRGNSLCHGIAGNGYMLHTLFRTFNKLSRASDDK